MNSVFDPKDIIMHKINPLTITNSSSCDLAILLAVVDGGGDYVTMLVAIMR